MLHAHNISAPGGDLFSEANRDWWEDLPLSSTDRLRVRHDLALIDYLSTQIEEAEVELARIRCAIQKGRISAAEQRIERFTSRHTGHAAEIAELRAIVRSQIEAGDRKKGEGRQPTPAEPHSGTPMKPRKGL